MQPVYAFMNRFSLIFHALLACIINFTIEAITGEGDPEIDALILKRYEAKKAKNFADADKIRDDLKAQGIEVADVRGGAVWKRI